MTISITDVHLGVRFFNLDDLESVVFDIDGTLADLTHRRKWVQSKPKNWAAFEKNMHLDKPIQPIIEIAQKMEAHGIQVVFCSGRGSQNRKVTEDWLAEHVGFDSPLFMRKEKDYRSDYIVKKELLLEMYEMGISPDLAIDDRDQVVQMWREMKIDCVQVAE